MKLEEFLENVRSAIVDYYHASKYSSVDESDYERLESIRDTLQKLLGDDCYYPLCDGLDCLKIADDIKIEFMLMGAKVDVHATVYGETTVVGHVEKPKIQYIDSDYSGSGCGGRGPN